MPPMGVSIWADAYKKLSGVVIVPLVCAWSDRNYDYGSEVMFSHFYPICFSTPPKLWVKKRPYSGIVTVRGG